MPRPSFPSYCAALIVSLWACGGDGGGIRTTAPPPPRPAANECQVVRLLDGDTFDCTSVGRVRFIGIDAPEMGQSPFGAQALAELTRLMPVGTSVQLQKDVSEKDVFDRTLAYVWQGPVLMNELMVQRGFALAAKYPPDTLKAVQLSNAQQAAQQAQAGLWRTGGFTCTPANWRRGACQ